jgi:hemerythrin superfamily protein
MFGTTSSESVNALDLLKRDHDEVDAMFRQFEDMKDDGDAAAKESLVEKICDALTVHAQIEEEIFYPAARRALQQEEGKDLLDEAAVEHQTLKDLVGRLESAPIDDPLYDAGVKVLSEYVKHHVKEEEKELFPKVKSSGLDLADLGGKLEARKTQLQARAGRGSRNGLGGRRMRRGSGTADEKRTSH